MRKMLPVLLCLFPAALFGAGERMQAVFIDPDGQTIGSVTLTQLESGVLVDASAAGLPPGEHGFHFHETGDCDPQTGFQSAGDHYAPGEHQHGLDVARGPHAGDMPNQFVDAKGQMRVNLLNTRVSLEDGHAPLLDGDGSALVIHAGADDYRSQPSGDAGDRIACAEIAP